MAVMHISIWPGLVVVEDIMILQISGTDMKGRMVSRNSSNQFEWYINSSGTIQMTVAAGGLYVGGTLVSASDKTIEMERETIG